MTQVRSIAYRRLASQLREEIERGGFSNGKALPTEERLAEVHAVSRSTVRRAMQELVADGIVYRVAGRGTFAVDNLDQNLRQFGSFDVLLGLAKDTQCELISPLENRVDIEAAGRMRLDSDSVYTLSLRRLIGDVPFSFSTVWLPPSIGELLQDVDEFRVPGERSRFTVIGSIEARLPVQIDEVEQSISAVALPQALAQHLSCGAGSPVMRVDRLYFDPAGSPVELAVSYFDPRYHTNRARLRRRES